MRGRSTGLLIALLWGGCVTTEVDRRAREIAAGERITSEMADGAPQAPELRFQLASLQLEQADALDASDAGVATEGLRERALAGLDTVILRHPSYSRRDEVLFWRAEALTGLRRWQEAVVAWRAVPVAQQEKNRVYARWRLAQSLRHTDHCDEALGLLDGMTTQAVTRERCLCLRALNRPCAQ